MAEKYIISEASTYFNEVSIQRRSEESWCIFCNGSVFSKSKNCYTREPSPSNRTHEFIEDTRFSSKEEAYQRYCEFEDSKPF